MRPLPVLPEPLPGLPGTLGIRIRFDLPADDGVSAVDGDMVVTAEHLNPAGTVHAAAIVALADTACGYGCLAAIPESADGFTTVELKSNHVGAARSGDMLTVRAEATHRGSTTQVWDAQVQRNAADGARTIAVFRCTQLVLYPR